MGKEDFVSTESSPKPKVYQIPQDKLAPPDRNELSNDRYQMPKPIVNYYTAMNDQSPRQNADDSTSIPIYQMDSMNHGSLPNTPRPMSPQNPYSYPKLPESQRPDEPLFPQDRPINIPDVPLHAPNNSMTPRADVVIIEDINVIHPVNSPWQSKHPVAIVCPRCHRMGMTIVRDNISAEGLLLIILMALFCFIWALCCLPCVTKTYTHYCRYCGAFLGKTYRPLL